MKNNCSSGATVGLLLAMSMLALTASPARSRDDNAAGDTWADYDIILTRNIFSRTRQPARVREARQEEPRPVAMPNPESYYILKGIAQEDDVFVAFVEDKRGGTVLRLRQGDSIARGSVAALNLDTLEYQIADQKVTVRLGSDLEGGYGAVTSADLMEWSQMAPAAAPPAAGSPAPAPSGDEAEILKRLMEQRKQQLGQ